MTAVRKILIRFLVLLLIIFGASNVVSAVKANIKEESPDTKPKLERHFVFETIPQNLSEIVHSAGRIFAGHCVKVNEINSDETSGGLPVIEYTFSITDPVKGVGGKEKITFKQWAPTARVGKYEEGKKYVLFLYPDSDRSLTSPVGFSQGLFEVESRGIIRKKETVKNKLNNKGLARNLRTQKIVKIEADKYINDYLQECSELGIPMRYKEFMKAVKYLVNK